MALQLLCIAQFPYLTTSVVILIHSIVLQGLFTQSSPFLFRLFGILHVNIIVMNILEYEIQRYS